VGLFITCRVAEKCREGHFRVDSPINDLRPIGLDQELQILIKEGTAGHATAWALWHLDPLGILEVH